MVGARARRETRTRSRSAFYRWWVAGGQIVVQKNVGGGKIDPVSLQYDPVAHRFLRIRHDSSTNQVSWETRAAGGQWQVRHSELWNPAVPFNLRFELKGGTSAGQSNPGVVLWDNFDAHR